MMQSLLIEEQLNMKLNNISTKQSLVDQLTRIYHQYVAIGKPVERIKSTFWKQYEIKEKNACLQLENSLDLGGLYIALDSLTEYSIFVTLHNLNSCDESENENHKMASAAKRLLQSQCNFIIAKISSWKIENASFMDYWEWSHTKTCWWHSVSGSNDDKGFNAPPGSSPFQWKQHVSSDTSRVWRNGHTNQVSRARENPGNPKPTWENLSPVDWHTIIRSILLLSYDRLFCLCFGREKVHLELLLQFGHFNRYLRKESDSSVNPVAYDKLQRFLKGSFKNGMFEAEDPTGFRLAAQVELPQSLSNVNHSGHLAWKVCGFLASLADDDRFVLGSTECIHSSGINGICYFVPLSPLEAVFDITTLFEEKEHGEGDLFEENEHGEAGDY
jgi:hypothetical protein